jgi:hypothetical protein
MKRLKKLSFDIYNNCAKNLNCKYHVNISVSVSFYAKRGNKSLLFQHIYNKSELKFTKSENNQTQIFASFNPIVFPIFAQI